VPGSNHDLGKAVPLITTEPPTPIKEARKDDEVSTGSDETGEACCGINTKTLKTMMDFSVLKNPVFILFTVSNFCTSVGFNIPYVYISVSVQKSILPGRAHNLFVTQPQAISLGVEKSKASMLLAVIGIANTVGRIILGYISDKPWVNRLLVYNMCLTICGLCKNC
jgi:MFS transporter, MCT family, solute carrier family 16 (monocarboxylic acid transporters), member 14